MESDNYNDLVKASKEAHRKWRLVPAPQRGDVIRQFGNELRKEKNDCKTLRRIATMALVHFWNLPSYLRTFRFSGFLYWHISCRHHNGPIEFDNQYDNLGMATYNFFCPCRRIHNTLSQNI